MAIRLSYNMKHRMKTVKIFLASSSELEGDRLQIESQLERKNRTLKKLKLEFELIHWEYFIDTISKTRLQDEYNEALRQCDLFVILAFTKMGKFSREEFNVAYKTFQEKNKPKILVYFKNQDVKIHQISFEEITSLHEFKNAIHDKGHFPNYYDNIEELKNHLYDQLEKIYIHPIGEEADSSLEGGISRRLEKIEEKLNKFYKPIVSRLKKDDNLWRLSSKLSSSSEALPLDASENFEEKYILPNHREVVQILNDFSYLKLDDPVLEEEIGKYIRHVAVFETIRSTESMKHLNPIDLNLPYPKYFKALLEDHIENLETQLGNLKSNS